MTEWFRRKTQNIKTNTKRDTKEGMWVKGLPPSVMIITTGQEFVKDGEKVRISINGDKINE